MKALIAYPYVRYLKNKLKPTFGFDCDSDDLRKQGVLTLPEAWSKECPRPIASKESFDSLGFCGVGWDGSALIVRITRRTNRTAEVLLYLRMSNGDEYQLPNHPDVYIYNTDERSFTAAGLCLEVIEPLRCWRVMFNGYLRKGIRSTVDESEDDVYQVKFNFIWHPLHGYMGFPEDFSIQSMAQLLSSRKWSSEFCSPFTLFTNDWQEQFGQMHGVVTIETEDIEMRLRGLKLRKHGIDQEKSFNFSFQGILHNGSTFHLFAICNNIIKKFVYGYLCTADSMKILPIYNCDLNVDLLRTDRRIVENLSVKFVADGIAYLLKTNSENSKGMTVYVGEDWDTLINFQVVKFSINDKPGNGIIEISANVESPLTRPTLIQDVIPFLEDLNYLKTCDRLILEFSEDECKSSQIVGGKGMSLALLYSLDYNSRKFSIPDGFCLTKAAFDLHISENPHLTSCIDQLCYVAGHNRDVLEGECKTIYITVSSTSLSEIIQKSIIEKLKMTFGENYENRKFAIRSSALGEDGEELSAAGQNDTILGAKGLEQIFMAVVKCWASQFAFRSVEYKRQNGQPLYSGMGVVIQEMVNADIAGVLFSRDPISGSKANIVITSNFGLGESVVSASADPDYIKLRRTWNDELHLTEDNVIGSKRNMIMMNDEGGTSEVYVDVDKCSKLTVDNELAIRLGNIALYLEKCFGTPRDIEWAVCEQTIYLLQSRPMTGNCKMTDFEIIHEFDSPMRTDIQYYSTANVGEVMPGAQTPLTTTSVVRSQTPFIQKFMTWRVWCHRYDPTLSDVIAVFYGHAMQDLVQMRGWNLNKEKKNFMKAAEVGIYGRILDDADIVTVAFERFTIPPLKSRLLVALLVIKGILFRNGMVDRTVKLHGNYKDPTLSGETIEDVFRLLGEHLRDIEEAMLLHSCVTIVSTAWTFLALQILSVEDEIGLDQYSDFAYLVGSCIGAESGNVPFSLKELALSIAKEMEPSEFLAMESLKALEWLQNENHEAGKKYKSFIERHGHRGLKEFDMSCLSWEIDPMQIVIVLQSMLKSLSSCKDSVEKSIDEVIRALKTPLSTFKRRQLKWTMKKCREGVCNREQTKSMAIKVYEGLRLGYRRLANMLVTAGIIPDVNLIFFFTHDELDRLLKTRSPLLIQRAKQRAKLHSYMDKLIFEEMITGYPVPIDIAGDTILPENVDQIKGYPVSQGRIEGKARVVNSFHDVHTIQPGEILITSATDIGWSPYFPMLGGVVTEIGGLVSHGAVVAREYGLPCVVGAQNATRFFKTGDIILLDATKGTISRISSEEQLDRNESNVINPK